MRIVFLQAESENLAVEYLSAALKSKGHEVFLVFDSRVFDSTIIKSQGLNRFFDVENLLIRKTLSLKPDLVAFSVLTGDYQWAAKMARAIKENSIIPVIFG